jgi:hypothetical protein
MGLKVKQVDGLQAALDAKLAKNTAITGATKTKITYDANGLVTAGADLAAADLPTGIDAAKINTGAVTNTEFNYLDGVTSAIQTQIDNKVTKNANITAATKAKVTYDVKGLITAGADLIESDIPTLSQSKITSLVTDLAGKALKIVGGTSGNIVTHNAAGVIQDSGKKFDDAGTTVNDIWSASKVQTAINAGFGANDAMVYKGVQNCSTNPNYPAGVQGETYRVSVAGKIGGASGVNVEIGDLIICITDSAAGTHAVVGANWNIIQSNIDGAVTGSDSAAVTTEKIAVMDGTSGRIIKAGTKTIQEVIDMLTVNETVLIASPTTNNYQTTPVATITGFFTTLPASEAKTILSFNGLVLREGSTAAGYSDCWERSGTNLLVKVPYDIETTDVIMGVFATK